MDNIEKLIKRKKILEWMIDAHSFKYGKEPKYLIIDETDRNNIRNEINMLSEKINSSSFIKLKEN